MTHWRVRSFFVDSQLEEFLNSVKLGPEQIREMHSVVQGPRTGVRMVFVLNETQLADEEAWVARTSTPRASRGGSTAPTA